MSVQDLIANWEEALALALSQPDERGAIELTRGDLETVADRRIASAGIRSNVVAGWRIQGSLSWGKDLCIPCPG